VKNLVTHLIAVILWLLLFFRFGDSPRFAKIFLWTESPLIIIPTPDKNQSFQSQKRGKIEFDEFGVPRILAKNEKDAAYFLGWMHGKERRFQMEMIRRTVQGTLSEIVGEKAISSDVFWRRFQFSKQWRNWYAQQPQALKDYFQSYAQGVNDQWQQQPATDIPIEFFILDFQPKEFQKQDMFYLLRYMDFSLNYDESELAILETKKQLPTQVFDFFYANKTEIENPILSNSIELNMNPNTRNISAISAFSNNNRSNFWIEPPGKSEIGSNNWAVGNSKLIGANASLSNDPHLKLQLPNTWYEVNISTPLGNKSGFTLAGSPFIISGNNDSIAWGITNATWTLTHFFPIHQSSVNQISLNKEIIPTQKEVETIEIRGKNAINLSIQKCKYGIIDTIKGKNYLIQWVGNAPTQLSNEALSFWGLEHSKNIHDAEKSLEDYGHPPQNFVIADHNGEIFQATCGFLGNSTNLGPSIWKKAQTTFQEKNPNRGFVFSANQPQSSHPSIHGLSNSFAPEARAKGIKIALEKSQTTIQDLLSLQTRKVDEEWIAFRKKFIFYIPKSYSGLKKEMINWNGEMDENSVQATIFAVVRHFLHRELIQHCLGEVAFHPHNDRINELLLNAELIPGKVQSINISRIWEQGMVLGIDSMIRVKGKNWRNWSYGQFFQGEIQHITKIKAFGMGNWSFNGSPRSVNVLRLGKGIHGASMRNTVIFTKDGYTRYSINFGGQSGRFFSNHYADQIQPWKDGLFRKQISSTFKCVYAYEFHP
jgi:penicillin amidase